MSKLNILRHFLKTGNYFKATFGERSISDLKIMSCERHHDCDQEQELINYIIIWLVLPAPVMPIGRSRA